MRFPLPIVAASLLSPLALGGQFQVGLTQALGPQAGDISAEQALVIDLSQHFHLMDSDPVAVDSAAVTGPIVRIETELQTSEDSGAFYIELLDDYAPLSADNFLSYVEDGSWRNSIIHRAHPDFVMQTGGFYAINAVYQGGLPRVTSKGDIPGEFNLSNLKGTLAMARGGALNLASNEWFINLSDNNGADPERASFDLDRQNFTVFARLIGSAQQVVDAINAKPKHFLREVLNPPNPFGDIRQLSEVFDYVPLDTELGGGIDPYDRTLPQSQYQAYINNVVTNWSNGNRAGHFLTLTETTPVSIYPQADGSDSILRFRIESNNPAVTATLVGSQLQIATDSNTPVEATLTVTAEAFDRNGASAHTLQQSFSVSLGEPASFNLANAIAPSSSSEYTLQIATDGPWTIDAGEASWLQLSAASGSGPATITVSVNANANANARQATLTLNNGSDAHRLLQQGTTAPTLSLSSEQSIARGLLDGSSNTFTFAIASNAAWQLTGLPDWIQADHLSGIGNQNITLTLASNVNAFTRGAILSVSNGTNTQTHLVLQCQRVDFNTWLNQYFTPDEIAAMGDSPHTANPDGDTFLLFSDGVPATNGHEYIFGTRPNSRFSNPRFEIFYDVDDDAVAIQGPVPARGLLHVPGLLQVQSYHPDAPTGYRDFQMSAEETTNTLFQLTIPQTDERFYRFELVNSAAFTAPP